VPALRYDELASRRSGEDSAAVARRVIQARRTQLERFTSVGMRHPVYANAQMGPQHVKRFCPVSSQCDEILRSAIDRLGLSARAYHRVLKVARTIADLENEPNIKPSHVTEAVQYRSLDRSSW